MDRVCPMLGLAGDRRSAVDGVDGAHRCHAEEPPAPLERSVQAQLCLTSAHERCERYTGFITRSGTATPGRSAVGGGLVSTRMLLAPQPAWRGIAGRARGARPIPFIAAGAGVLAVGIGTAAVAGGVLGGGTSAGSATAEPTAAPTEQPTRRPAAAPTASPRPTASPSPTPASTATPAPATPVPTIPPTPPPPQTYVVQEGDTLAEIAARYGTTSEALQQANGIEDPNQIVIGQVLVIP